jgi:hypothetical protein
MREGITQAHNQQEDKVLCDVYPLVGLAEAVGTH